MAIRAALSFAFALLSLRFRLVGKASHPVLPETLQFAA
ncbi:hypothetical protein PI124_g16551 [Phytophthora idaei]|nr:hypothetical protein PI125_g3814 [Phytophthora idaei]KAG3143088.1 hypothetical protein PI126_g14772 [Phytophthora idaei]KAG3238487.1 hypothetical protein PI124_g16551 [Phytophthora idaei]